MYDVADLETFIEVVERGGVTAAANALDLAPSTVSHRIAKVEQRLRTRLFHRDSRHFAPTYEGEQFFSRVRDIVEALREAESEAMGGVCGVHGALKITLPPWLLKLYVLPALAPFQQAHPRLHLEFLATDQFVNIVEERQDIGLRVGAPPKGALLTQKLADNSRIICASPCYIRQHGAPQTAAELEDHPFIMLPWQPQIVVRGAHEEPYELKPKRLITLTDAEALTVAAKHGLGLAIRSELAVRAEIASGELVEVAGGALLNAEAPVHLLRSGAVTPPRKIAVFSDFIKKVISAAAAPPSPKAQ